MKKTEFFFFEKWYNKKNLERKKIKNRTKQKKCGKMLKTKKIDNRATEKQEKSQNETFSSDFSTSFLFW